MKKKIMVFMFSLKGGGAQRTIVNVINNLNKKNYEVILVLGTNYGNDYIGNVNASVRIENLNKRRLRNCLVSLRNVIRRENPDLMFTTLIDNNVMLLIAKLISFKRIPTLIREANTRSQAGETTILNKLKTFIFYNILASKVIALSEGVKNDLIKNYKIWNKKIKVIYNPVEIDKIDELGKEKITDFSKENDEKLIVTVGRLAKQKDYSTLIKAMDIITKSVSTKLMILGEGESEGKLKEQVKNLNLTNKVEFLGFKSNPYKYLKNADLFILSSRWEGFGHVIVEAMATRTPVIVTDCKSGPAEITQNGKYGVLVPVGDFNKIAEESIKLLLNENKSLELAESGYLRSKDFDAALITKEYEKLFEECLK